MNSNFVFGVVGIVCLFATANRAHAQPANPAVDPVIYWADEAESRAESLEKRLAALDGVAQKISTADAETSAWLARAREKIADVEARAKTPADIERAGRGLLGTIADQLPWVGPLLLGGVGFGAHKLGQRGERKRHIGTADPIHAIAHAVQAKFLPTTGHASGANGKGFSSNPNVDLSKMSQPTEMPAR